MWRVSCSRPLRSGQWLCCPYCCRRSVAHAYRVGGGGTVGTQKAEVVLGALAVASSTIPCSGARQSATCQGAVATTAR
jgi:hypothetical protein